jgi:hypothetical protein
VEALEVLAKNVQNKNCKNNQKIRNQHRIGDLRTWGGGEETLSGKNYINKTAGEKLLELLTLSH